MINVDCPQCGAAVKAPDDLAGKKGKCFKCQTIFTLPELIVDLELAEDAGSVPPPLPSKLPLADEHSADSKSIHWNKSSAARLAERYPELRKEIARIRVRATMCIVLGWCLCGVFMIASLFISRNYRGEPSPEGVVIAVISSVLVLFFAYAHAASLRITAERLQIEIDTEENTRHSSELLKELLRKGDES